MQVPHIVGEFFTIWATRKPYSWCSTRQTPLIIDFSTVFSNKGSYGKGSACSAGDLGLIPGSGRSPGEGHGNPLQYFYLEDPTDRGAWKATVHRVAKSQTRLKWLSTRAKVFILGFWIYDLRNLVRQLFPTVTGNLKWFVIIETKDNSKWIPTSKHHTLF